MKSSGDWIPHSKPTLTEGDANAASKAVASGYVGSGPRVEEFERQVAARVDRKYSRATATGSAALHLALLASGVKPGDAVLLPAFVCRAVLNVVLGIGAKPVLVDVNPADFCVTPDSVRNALKPFGESATKRASNPVLVLVHSFGAAVDAAEFEKLGVTIIEDAASSFGASLKGKPVGASGLFSVLSFASTKMMTTGQGGMILSDSEDLMRHVDSRMDYDSVSSGTADSVAYNYGFTDVQAALGLSQLESLDGFVTRRRNIAGAYDSALKGLDGIQLPSAGEGHAYYRYVLLADAAPAIVSRLNGAGIDARASVTHFLYDYLGGATGFPMCESFRNRIVSLPIYPSLSDAQVDRIASAARDAILSSR